jgi:EmrB/QacA subfamily drug resistance transporter
MTEAIMTEPKGADARLWVLVLTSIASFMVALDALVVTTALSAIQRDLGASLAMLEWIVNAYNLSFAVLLMTGAALGDRLGRRRMFVTGLCVFTAASAACALSGSIGGLIAARALQGAGAALVMPLAMALLSAGVPPAARPRALGIFSGITGLAVLGGPVVGGAVAEGIAWPWIFWLNLPIAALLIPLVRRHVDESFGTRAGLDIPGLAFVTLAALCLVWALVRGNAVGWGSVETLAALAAALALAAGFIAWELRAAAPMVPMRFFASRAFSAGNAAGFLLYGALYGALFFMAQFLQTALGHDALGAGLRLLPWTAVVFVVAPIAGALVGRIGERPLVAGGLLLQAVGLAAIGWLAAPDVAYGALVAPLIIAGAGVSMAMPAAQNAAFGAVAPHEIGKASGTFNMVRFLGGVFGIALLAAVFAATGRLDDALAFSAGFAAAMTMAAGLSLLGAAAGLCLPAALSRDAPAQAAKASASSA